ncbi:hypothetical protein OUZ56_031766 [Daphnia magna]|uniref:Uncharacterized protein n=1 Tax=Daphnia magna TaxID=35525 RepID=A0ABQ9ZV57_9CRUS|nr:hypothetical protein OUZ56_031766 [Daphnia magna]
MKKHLHEGNLWVSPWTEEHRGSLPKIVGEDRRHQKKNGQGTEEAQRGSLWDLQERRGVYKSAVGSTRTSLNLRELYVAILAKEPKRLNGDHRGIYKNAMGSTISVAILAKEPKRLNEDHRGMYENAVGSTRTSQKIARMAKEPKRLNGDHRGIYDNAVRSTRTPWDLRDHRFEYPEIYALWIKKKRRWYGLEFNATFIITNLTASW